MGYSGLKIQPRESVFRFRLKFHGLSRENHCCGGLCQTIDSPQDRKIALELSQKALIVGGQKSNLGDFVFDHGDAVDTKAKSEACELFGVDIDILKNRRVDRSTSSDFNPARPFTGAAASTTAIKACDIYFG